MRPVDYYKGNPEEIKKLRDEKLAIARERRLATNREFNRILKVRQTTSYLKPVFCSI
ncbi:hypothetical protein HKBW3S42_01100 [Candidatus Hakubella thermalkaliphila]|uniref:Uncharacterized protein n=1 Tax=Candidatus Hakubella thermalkaliphila TaxID=2754717 RepID=A0A6V8PJF0_9ACTN|nr:hypothetical protein HKBW3S42_01100 [Candidatus Hakubella thermalkaliphila]